MRPTGAATGRLTPTTDAESGTGHDCSDTSNLRLSGLPATGSECLHGQVPSRPALPLAGSLRYRDEVVFSGTLLPEV